MILNSLFILDVWGVSVNVSQQSDSAKSGLVNTFLENWLDQV
jgi:hypothetical protein